MTKRSLSLVTLAILIIASLPQFGGSCKKKDQQVPPPVVQPPVTQDTTSRPVEPPPPPKQMLQETQFQTIYFDFDKYNLRPDAKAALDANLALLQEYPDVVVKIEGHCDERGTTEYNLALGDRRARAAMDYMTTMGISAGRLSVISFGEERPAMTGSNEGAWSKNRRCEFRIVSQ